MRLNKTRCALLAGALALAMALAMATGAAQAAETNGSSSSSSSSASSTGAPPTGRHKSSTATQARQSPLSAAAGVVGALGSLVPALVGNVAPLVLLLGLGALMMPQLSMSAMGLLRESRRSANDQQHLGLANAAAAMQANPFAQYAARPFQSAPQDYYYFVQRSLPSLLPGSLNSGPLLAGLRELLERVVRAIDNADKRYN